MSYDPLERYMKLRRKEREEAQRIHAMNERYDAWFFSPEAKRQYDALMDACASPNFEMYADPESPRGRRLRAKHEKEGTRQRGPRRGPRQVRVLKGQLTSGERFAILKRDSYCCRICGASQAKDRSVELHVDHITPRSKGGTNDPMNLWTLCAACNIGKGTQDL